MGSPDAYLHGHDQYSLVRLSRPAISQEKSRTFRNLRAKLLPRECVIEKAAAHEFPWGLILVGHYLDSFSGF
jgi:hypothetical protein